MGGGTQKETVIQQSDPWGPAQPYIIKGMEQTNQTYDANQPTLQKYAADQYAQYGQIAPGAQQGIMSAQSLVNDNLAGKNLNGNPYLEGIIGKTRDSVTAGVNDQFGPAGRFGSGYHAKILADELAKAENDLRFQNYGMERGYQQQAINDSQSLMGGAQSLLNNAADLPWVGVGALNGNIRQASSGYGTSNQTTTKTGGGGLLGSILGSAASAGATALFSDERLKENIELVNVLPDGLPIYSFTYKPDTGFDLPEGKQIGVMAQDVAEWRPWALGPVVKGFMTVDYGRL